MAMPRFTVTVFYNDRRTIQVAARDEHEAVKKAAERVGRTVGEVIGCRVEGRNSGASA